VSGNGNGAVSGELVSDQEERANRFHKLENELVRAATATRTAFVYMAKRLVEIQEERLWALEYDSWNQFLASPDIDIAPPTAKAMCGVYRTLVIERKVPEKELEGVDLRKLQTALPAIKTGEVRWQEGIADAKALSRKDMERNYKRGRDAPLDAEEEPEMVPCPTCGSWVEESKVSEEEAA
jgi:hypothetical protein